jgi:hypothetical protein
MNDSSGGGETSRTRAFNRSPAASIEEHRKRSKDKKSKKEKKKRKKQGITTEKDDAVPVQNETPLLTRKEYAAMVERHFEQLFSPQQQPAPKAKDLEEELRRRIEKMQQVCQERTQRLSLDNGQYFFIDNFKPRKPRAQVASAESAKKRLSKRGTDTGSGAMNQKEMHRKKHRKKEKKRDEEGERARDR